MLGWATSEEERNALYFAVVPAKAGTWGRGWAALRRERVRTGGMTHSYGYPTKLLAYIPSNAGPYRTLEATEGLELELEDSIDTGDDLRLG